MNNYTKATDIPQRKVQTHVPEVYMGYNNPYGDGTEYFYIELIDVTGAMKALRLSRKEFATIRDTMNRLLGDTVPFGQFDDVTVQVSIVTPHGQRVSLEGDINGITGTAETG